MPNDGGRPQCSHVDLMAFSVIVLITIICALGTKQSSRTNLILVRGERGPWRTPDRPALL